MIDFIRAREGVLHFSLLKVSFAQCIDRGVISVDGPHDDDDSLTKYHKSPRGAHPKANAAFLSSKQ